MTFFFYGKIIFVENLSSHRPSFYSGLLQKVNWYVHEILSQLCILVQESFTTFTERFFTVHPKQNLSPVQDM